MRVKTNTIFRSLFRKSTVAGLVFLLLVVGSSPVVEARIKRDWSRVQKVVPGTRIKVELYKNRVFQGKRNVRGRFRSATAVDITLLLPDGQTRTVQKQAVSKVMVARPLYKRYEVWITAGVFATLFASTSIGDTGDLTSAGEVTWAGLIVGGPTIVAYLAAPMGSIYSVPGQTPPGQGPTITVPEKSDVRPDGSKSETLSNPVRLRQQARHSLIRKGLPLDLSPRPGTEVHRSATTSDFR